MEHEKIQKDQETQKTQEPKKTQGTQKKTSEAPQKKEKNPKRVAAGKKRRKSEMQQTKNARSEIFACCARARKDHKDTPLESSLYSPSQTVVTVYKNYVPLALVAAGAVFHYYHFCHV